MWFQGFADLVLVVHLGFILFVLLGGLLCLRWRWMPWFHLPAVLWAVALGFGGWICPLTPLENSLRRASSESGYSGGFIEHYLVPIIYPAGLTSSIQWYLGFFVILLNLSLYSFVYSRRGKVM
ncbi:MAG: hypothetical protein NPIRA02_21780 [Nitrospirales bacterium]|nr:MAG: hypothetical protein NPIRA02_21780 [Nitrospirales bacterium]